MHSMYEVLYLHRQFQKCPQHSRHSLSYRDAPERGQSPTSGDSAPMAICPSSNRSIAIKDWPCEVSGLCSALHYGTTPSQRSLRHLQTTPAVPQKGSQDTLSTSLTLHKLTPSHLANYSKYSAIWLPFNQTTSN